MSNNDLSRTTSTNSEYFYNIVLLSLLFSLILMAGCKNEYNAIADAKQPANTGKEKDGAREVKTLPVVEKPLERTIAVTGTLAVYDQAVISVKVPGRLNEITIDIGTRVKKGEKIGQIDAQDYKLRVQQAEAALSQARTRLGLTPDGSDQFSDPNQVSIVRQNKALLADAQLKLERTQTLMKSGVISQADLDAAETAQKVALTRFQDSLEEIHNRQAILSQRQTELNMARQQLLDTSIYAPFDGIIQEKRAGLGEFLAAGAPIGTVVKADPLRLKLDIPERDAPNVQYGQTVRVRVESDEKVYQGRIVRFSPTITQENRILVVEAEVTSQGTLRPGAFVRAEIVLTDKSPSLMVPKSSIVRFAGIEKVITVQDGKAVEKIVTTGRQIEDQIELLTGIKSGEEVVVEPGNLQSGQAVKVTN